jgi:signal transduction histidine kinase/putative methionine-R-sulfoxide reductase with GAF domain
MPSEVSTACPDQSVDVLKRELTEARDQQRATTEILSVIARSPTDSQPVFDTIATCATHLCNGFYGVVFRFDGEMITVAADSGVSPQTAAIIRSAYPAPPGSGTISSRALLERRVINVTDAQDSVANPAGAERARARGYRAILSVPMLKGDTAIGAINVVRREAIPFTEAQVELLQTFADQAVIAIENTRLFDAEQASKRELQESLDYQTAISDVLGIISRSKFDLQPVLDTIARGAARLCGGVMGGVFRYDGKLMHVGAMVNFAPGGEETWRGLYPRPATTDTVTGRAILEESVVNVADVEAETRAEWARELARTGGYRSAMAVPMLREGIPIGAIIVARVEPGSYPEAHIDLLKTFADQAVIAIENTRLFEEVQSRNRALAEANTQLTETLEQQTATSRILRVISRSPTDVQPMFETTVESAARLCDADRANIYRFDGEYLRVVASYNQSPELREFLERNPIAPGPQSVSGRAALHRHTVQVPNLQADPEITYGGRVVEPIGTALSVPILKGDTLLGVIFIYRLEVRPFTSKQIALVETFADQAAIAIENTRLFDEVQARNRDLTALGDVGRAVSSSLDLKIVLKTIVDRAVDLSATDAGSIFYFREELGRFELGETSGLESELVRKYRRLDIAEGQTGLGEAIAKRQPLQLPDVVKRPSNALRDAALEAGLHAALIVPLLGSEGALGALVLQRRRIGEFSQSVVSLMQSFADQSAIALENARLFDEIAQKSRELEIASQHKSQFVANMSHELRTPLAAILGYAELIQEGFYGPLSDKALESLTRIRSNGKHLLGLINTVLDIAKIESGQFTLNMSEYAIESVVETVRSATESLAQNKKLTLKTEVADSLPIGVGDEQRLTQVLLNLVGNAIKFTDAGEVRVTAKAIDGHFAVTVADTGPGIPAEHQTRIFDQFHQVDSSNTKAKGGTGLGLAIAKQIVEMHGGRIWVESTIGKGSTFQMEIPARAEVTRSG